MSTENNDEKRDRELIEIKAHYFSSNADKLLAYYYFLEKHINRGDKIPARVLKKFVSFFEEPNTINEEIVFIRKKQLIEKTINFFKKIRGYSFEKTIKVSAEDWKDIPYPKQDFYDLEVSFDNLINNIYHGLPFKENPKRNKEKRDFIIGIHERVDKYISKVYTKDEYSSYRRMVITAYIVAQFGVLKTEEEFNDADYTGYLYDRIEDRLKKYK